MIQGSENRGAALIIAVAIFTILLVVALTFYSSSKIELQTATNVENGMRTDLISNAGIALAVSMLQNDSQLYPHTTSIDHPWTTYFNGTWIAGKPWAFANGVPWAPNPFTGFDRTSVPYVLYENVLAMEADITNDIQTALTANNLDRVARLQQVRAPLYVPRYQGFPTLASLEDPATNAFVVDYAFDQTQVDPNYDPSTDGAPTAPQLTPQQQIAFWADVDNDEDGLPDSVWIPVPIELFFGGVDKDEDGIVSVDEGGDGIDNDLDGFIDEENETAVFVYWGGNDGRDNDADGLVDEGDEQKLFLTAPIVDQDGFTMFNNIDVRVNAAVLAEYVLPYTGAVGTVVQNAAFTGTNDVDAIDNDYSMIVSDAKGHAYDFLNGDTTPDDDDERAYAAQQAVREYNRIDTSAYPTIAPFQVVSASGEPVCEIAGRVAVLITDEASKINLNTAGGLAATSDASGNLQLTWALNEGMGTREVDIRSVPNFGVFTGQQVAQLRNGSPEEGTPFAINTNLNGIPYEYDAALPGYGGVDDDGNALALSLNGIDDDGDGFVDELWEGIDEPAEHQLFRPLRNSLAETDAFDNDGDDSLDEIGEFGDRLFRTQDQVSMVDGFFNQADTPRWLRNSITTQSTDRNQRNQYYTRDGNGNILQQLIPPTSGLKLDYNYALADNIALALQEDWDYPNFADVFYASAVFSSPADPTDDVIALYSQGLRREDVNIVDAPFGLRESPTDPIVFDADAELRSYQLALNIMEHRDRDSVGNYAEVRVRDAWWQEVVGADNDPNTFDGDLNPGTIDGTGDLRQITYRMRGVESVRITELMVRPVRRVEAEAVVGGAAEFDPNRFSAAEGRTNDFDFVSETILEREPGLAPSNGSFDWQNDGNGILGAREVLETDSTLVSDGGAFSAPNVIQFRFGPSPQLPPGRYYLMFNSTDAAGNPTVTDPSDLDFVVKYAREDGAGVDSDILEDIINSPDDPFLFPTADEPQIGYQNGADPVTAVAGQESGWVFLPTSAADETLNVPVGSEGYAGVPASANLKNEAFTVVIPPYVQNPLEQYYLYVAIANTKTPGETLSINYFDFSQEPDHEWIEITNIAEGSEPVDVSGWQVQIGGDLTSVGTSLFTIPDRTLIAPNSSILLGFNKYDVGADNFGLPNANYGGWPDVFKNGIGLVRGPAAGDLNDISEPPVPRYAAVGETGFLDSIIWGTPLGSAAAQSIFYRPDPDENVDFIDSNGDGLGEGFGVGATPLASDDLVISSGLDDLPLGIVSGFNGGDASTKAWDRIIELDVAFPDTILEAGATPDDQRRNVARMVLGGGVLPNYPEFDLLDNDFDASVLDIDGIDNDGDGFIDEGRDGLDNDGDTLIDEEDESEGIDEGRFRRVNGLVVPGTYDDDFVDFGFASLPPDYVRGGGANLWWDWKNFVERRYFPGESVVVTLYQGSAGVGKIADRVTYTQHDVENRSFDDKLSCPYPSTEIPNAGIEWAWPANTMGIDFYKSLERRHPLFNGDRVGTQNRWLATDGNYDDWHEGTARISRLLGVPVIGLDEVGFGHGFSGSPLRPNFYQRRLEQPGGLVDHDPGVGSYIWTFDRAKVRNRQLASIGDLITVPHMTLTKQFGNAGAEILGAESLAGQGVMLGRDFPKDLRAVLETGRLDSIVLSVATADFYPLYPRYAHVGPPGGDDTLVQWEINPLSGVRVRGPRAWSPVFLTPLDLAGSEPPGLTIDTDPVAVPVFYPNLTNAPAYPIELNFLLKPIATYPNMGPVDFVGAPGVPAPRWPLEKRAVMYVSENPQGFEPSRYDHAQATPVGITVDHPSEALFVWDGDDGLPNGEYDLYVVTLDDLSGLDSPTQLAPSVSEDFGVEFVARALAADPAVAGVDIAVLTDVDGDRQVWFDSGNRLPDTEELGMTPGLPRPENYGLKTGLSPASDGSIHYGVVKVENNYLAVFIRNWAPPGTLNRVSRVVLTTRDKTTGRINVNTAITRMVEHSGGFGAYNPLVGMPGIIGEMLPNGTFNPRPVADTVDIEPDDLDSAGVSALDPLALNDPLGRAERIGAVTSRGNVGGDGLGLADGRGFQTVDRLDGRYYQFQSELVALGDNLIFVPALQLTPAFLAPNLVPNAIWPPEDAAETLQAAELQAIQFDEMLARYKRIANIVTARSDVFEIIVTAQSGYGFDANDDGLINWRDDEEFVVNGERKSRTVYER